MATQQIMEADRLQFLADAGRALTASLDYQTTLQNITRLIIPAFADWCVIDLVEGDGYKRVAVAHANPAQIEFLEMLLQEYPAGLDNPYGYQAVIRSGKSQIIPVIPETIFEQIARDARHLGLIRQLQLKSNICVPLTIRGSTFGALTFAYAESGRVYSHGDLYFAEELAHRIALAIEHAQLYKTERSLRQQAEAATERLWRLQALTAAFSETLTVEAVADVVVRREFVPLGVHLGVITLLSADTKALELIGHYGVPAALYERYRRMPMNAALPITDAVREKQPVWIPTADAYLQRYPNTAKDTLPRTKTQAMAALPLSIEGRVIGAIGMSFSQPQTFTDEDCAFMMAIAQQCAQAIQRAKLHEQAKIAAADEERARLARDLHDAVSQTLFSATTMAESIPLLWQRDANRGIEQLAEMVMLNRAAMAEMRSLLLELRPEAIVRTPLHRLLTQLIEAVKGRKRLEIQFTFEGSLDKPYVNAHLAAHVAFYRIAQESLNNIVKHSQAAHVTLHLACQPERWTLRVEDDGRGFDTTTLSAGLGMHTMRERAEAIGATLEISSFPGKGTHILLDYTMSDSEGQVPHSLKDQNA